MLRDECLRWFGGEALLKPTEDRQSVVSTFRDEPPLTEHDLENHHQEKTDAETEEYSGVHIIDQEADTLSNRQTNRYRQHGYAFSPARAPWLYRYHDLHPALLTALISPGARITRSQSNHVSSNAQIRAESAHGEVAPLRRIYLDFPPVVDV